MIHYVIKIKLKFPQNITNLFIHAYINTKHMSNIARRKHLLECIDEYNYIEKYFGYDKKGNIKYNEDCDQNFASRHIDNKKEYIGLNAFLDYIDNKTKDELVKELDQLDNAKVETTPAKILPSPEQLKIVNCVTNEQNVIVDAVAGSGKTTTVLFVARKNKDKKILQITYNKQLKLEVRGKVQAENLNNLEIHTYHSLAVRFYDSTAHTDDKLIKLLLNNTPPKLTKSYDIVIIDEIQDATPNYYSLINKFLIDMNITDSTLLMLGDKYQGIYEFKNADTRFLTLASKIWGKRKFTSLMLQESYRVTTQIAWFVNVAMLGQNRIVANRKGKHRVYYYRKNRFMSHTIFASRIMQFLKEGYKASDIFVLSPSLKGTTNNPVKRLENILVENKIPVYFSRNEEEGIDEDIIKGKVVFTTFHQSKGRERKIVFVYGFDNSYFNFHAREKDRNICPSELYVAITRASEILVILENETDSSLPFMKCDQKALMMSQMVEYNGKIIVEKNKDVGIDAKNNDLHNTSVVELTKFIDEEKSNLLIPLIDELYVTISKPSTKYTIEIPSSITTNTGSKEDVSDLNGLVIPAMYEAKISKQNSLEEIIAKMYKSSDRQTKTFIDENMPMLTKIIDENPIGYYLCLGNLYITLGEKIYSKLKQVDHYDWLTKDMLKVCNKNLAKNVGENAQYERELGQYEDHLCKYYQYVSKEFGKIDVRGRVDCIDDDTLWEFKCTSSLQTEHKLQLIVYAWIWVRCMKKEHGEKMFKLLNIRTGEVLELEYDSDIVQKIMDILFENKYKSKSKDDDEAFIEKCNNTILTLSQKKTGKHKFIFTDLDVKKKDVYSSDEQSDSPDNNKKLLNHKFF